MLKIKTLFNNEITFLMKQGALHHCKDKAETRWLLSIHSLIYSVMHLFNKYLLGSCLCVRDIKLDISKIQSTQKFYRSSEFRQELERQELINTFWGNSKCRCLKYLNCSHLYNSDDFPPVPVLEWSSTLSSPSSLLWLLLCLWLIVE